MDISNETLIFWQNKNFHHSTNTITVWKANRQPEPKPQFPNARVGKIYYKSTTKYSKYKSDNIKVTITGEGF